MQDKIFVQISYDRKTEFNSNRKDFTKEREKEKKKTMLKTEGYHNTVINE